MAQANDQRGDDHIRHIKAALNRPWLTQEEIDAEQRELDMSIERDKVWLRIAVGLVLIYAGYITYDLVKGWLP